MIAVDVMGLIYLEFDCSTAVVTYRLQDLGIIVQRVEDCFCEVKCFVLVLQSLPTMRTFHQG